MADVVGEARGRAEERQPQVPPGAADDREQPVRQRDRGDPQFGGDLALGEHVVRRDVERSAGRGADQRQRGPGQVGFVDELQRRVGPVGQQHAGGVEEEVGDEVAGPRAADDHRPGDGDGDRRMGRGELRHDLFHEPLVGGVVVLRPGPQRIRLATGDGVVGPGAVDGGAAGEEHAGRRHGRGGGEQPAGALDVRPPHGRAVAAGFDREGEVDERVGPEGDEGRGGGGVEEIAAEKLVGEIRGRRAAVDPQHPRGGQLAADLAQQGPAVEAGAPGDRDPRRRGRRGVVHAVTPRACARPRRRSRRTSAR